MLTLGAMYCVHLSFYLLVVLVLENKGYTEYEVPGVSSDFGCYEERNVAHFLRYNI